MNNVTGSLFEIALIIYIVDNAATFISFLVS